ncbi:hypothetical protein [Pantoea dispersa]|uniref:hypothetical protein n=1 Tax=Pantoea dispersa TaxID=59814 RepID=UPI001CA6826E|nr:hypothetical protein [Pantoea dispersa]QZY97856.1 hypothetical protein K7X52_24690 [Pantoea dispersa]
MLTEEIINDLAHPVTVQVINQGPGIWGNVATGLITAGAAIAAVMLTHRFTLKREKQASEEKRVREHHFIATELIFMLERYAELCARVATDDGKPNRERQHEYEPVTALPELNLSAITGDWRVLEPLHMFRIRELPVLQDEADRAIEAEWENFDPPLHTPYFKERQYQYARMGIRAVILAMRLRKEAALPSTRLADHAWSAVPLMRSVWRRERKWRAAEAIRIREWQDPVLQVNHGRGETHL